ncbi:hypothetical protein [Dyadobacter luticola]|uniref:Uncharacterized protein n=1 Tax=Dyadobacter luticola TaxID=1979387 RepID=A0A5R9KVM8_9BACT|nr:hypothetical protein [Dyadobacter luticola]TLV00322.1 hypothetical protein FEN17_12540 [Dyadobacter luticola]
MNNQTHSAESPDSMCLAYGQQVQQLFELNTPAEMAEHLWEIYSGFQLYDHQAGHNPRKVDIFYTFRDLVHFCQNVAAMKAA